MAHKLLIASASAGAGHTRAAAALKNAFDLSGRPGSAETVDIIEHTSPVFRRLYLTSYFSVISAAPWYWRFLYHRWDKKAVAGIERRSVCVLDRLNTGRFIRFVQERRPSHVLCTHFLPAEVLAWMRRTGRLDAHVGVAVTDYDAHRMWINEGTDHYFVPSDYLRGMLISKGAPADRVTTTGIPIDPAFARPIDRAAAMAELGLDPARPAILTTGGGTGRGGVRKTVATLAKCGDVQILAVTGHNERLRRALDKLKLDGPARLITYGFVDYIQTLMAAADLIVTKPGGMSTTECLAVGLPMVLTVPIPGQEEKNSIFLVGCGAALPARNTEELFSTVTDLLGRPDRLARMKAAALKTARPSAAAEIIDAVLTLNGG